MIMDAAGRYFASFAVETDPQPLPRTGRACGIDLGLGHFAVLDNGTKVAAPRFLQRAEKKLKRVQKDLSREQDGSANRDKARVRFEPTSQVCSACGVRDGPKPLHVRVWACAACGTVHDRDINAAKNIAVLGRREAQNARGGDVRPPLGVAAAGETGSHRGAA